MEDALFLNQIGAILANWVPEIYSGETSFMAKMAPLWSENSVSDAKLPQESEKEVKTIHKRSKRATQSQTYTKKKFLKR